MQTSNIGDNIIPIGSVICYAGDLSTEDNLKTLNAMGWLLCDGHLYKQSDYPELYAAIGTANGGDTANFNVPDLRDRFIRGVNGNAAHGDPDATGRVAANIGGAVGNKVGSLQNFATALPANNAFVLAQSEGHYHTVAHLTTEMHECYAGSTQAFGTDAATQPTEAGGAHKHTLTGYDNATIPICTALYFIIKANETTTSDGQLPVGVIVGFAGDFTTGSANWLACDGLIYDQNNYWQLGLMISNNYGGSYTDTGGKNRLLFNVPDFRGKFLRSTNQGLTRDPDVASRFALNTGGATGDNTGSAQGYATQKPAGLTVVEAGDHYHAIANVPTTDHEASLSVGTDSAYAWTDASTNSSTENAHSHTILGGDKETRPTNVYLNLLIAAGDQMGSAPPIGSIVPTGASTGDPSLGSNLYQMGWIPCIGQSLSTSVYAELYKVIGNIYGGDASKFNLPDLRGYFVVGAGEAKPIGFVLKQSKTGAPANPFETSMDGDHTHTVANVPQNTRESYVVTGHDLAVRNTTEIDTSTNGKHSHTLSGNDNESRPINVYVDYLIRFK